MPQRRGGVPCRWGVLEGERVGDEGKYGDPEGKREKGVRERER